MDMKQCVVVVTGASSGLGKAVAERLAAKGAKLVLVANTPDKLNAVATALQQQTEVKPVVADIADDTSAAKIVQTALDAFGRIDILVNNAGIWTDNELEAADPARRRKAFEINSLGTIQLIQAVLPHMQAANAGYICNVISTAGASDTEAGNNEDWMTYGATKWALTGYTKALTTKLQATPIRVTAFMPGGFESDLYESANAKGDMQHNQPWMMQTADVADAVLFCLTRPLDVQVEKLIVTKKMAPEA